MNDLNRRQFLRTTALASAIGFAALESGPARTPSARLDPEPPLVDTNVTLGPWPLRRLPLQETSALVAKLQHHRVTAAWTATFDALFHRDISSANARLASECRRRGRGLLVPFGSLNPALPGWQEDLQKCQTEYRMPGIRLFPNYHGYKLDSPSFATLLDLAARHERIVQIPLMLEDERMQHPPLQVPHVDASPLPALLKSQPKARLVLLNWSRALKPALLAKLAATGQVWFDIATLEGVGGVANLLKQIPVNRVLFGSFAPVFYFESAALKLKESVLSAAGLAAIASGNAAALTGKPLPTH